MSSAAKYRKVGENLINQLMPKPVMSQEEYAEMLRKEAQERHNKSAAAKERKKLRDEANQRQQERLANEKLMIQRTIQDLKLNLTNSQMKNDQMAKEWKEHQRKCCVVLSDTLEKEIGELREDKDRLERANRLLDEKLQKSLDSIEELKHKYVDEEEKAERMERSLATKSAEVKELRSEQKEASVTISDLKTQLLQKEEQFEQMRVGQQQASVTISDLKAQLLQKEEQLEQMRVALQQGVSELKAQLSQKHVQMEEMRIEHQHGVDAAFIYMKAQLAQKDQQLEHMRVGKQQAVDEAVVELKSLLSLKDQELQQMRVALQQRHVNDPIGVENGNDPEGHPEEQELEEIRVALQQPQTDEGMNVDEIFPDADEQTNVVLEESEVETELDYMKNPSLIPEYFIGIKCPRCGKAFDGKFKNGFRHHLMHKICLKSIAQRREQSGNLCGVCGLKIIRKTDLVVHMAKFHSKKPKKFGKQTKKFRFEE